MQALLALLTVAFLAVPAVANAAPERTVPRGFAGVVADGPLLNDPDVDLETEFDRMVVAGVESVRVEARWPVIQPYRSFAETPPAERGRFTDEGGVPTDWSLLDRIVALAASRGLSLLPVVQGTPAWATADGSADASTPPSSPTLYARFMATLAERYGSRGAFWDANPGLPRRPIRYWQVWNEPNLSDFWREQPFAPGYVRLLRAARSALREADPKSRVVLGALVNRSWTALARIYRQPGARRAFDVVAIHPFSHKVGSSLVILATVRKVMTRNRDRHKPLWATEVSWPSAKGKLSSPGYGWETTERGQALRVEKTYTLFGRRRTRRRLRLQRVFWYSWLSADRDPTRSFDYAGLRTIGPNGGEPKPAFAAFRRTALRLEGCRSKAVTATSCRR